MLTKNRTREPKTSRANRLLDNLVVATEQMEKDNSTEDIARRRELTMTRSRLLADEIETLAARLARLRGELQANEAVVAGMNAVLASR